MPQRRSRVGLGGGGLERHGKVGVAVRCGIVEKRQ